MIGRVVRGVAGCALVVAVACGCAQSYSWRSSVPPDMRTVHVPTFRNESDVSEAGAVAARQVLREIQREGTFRICSPDEAALEVQGVVKSVVAGIVAYDRHGRNVNALDVSARVEVSVIDKRQRKVLVNNRPYVAQASLTMGQDRTTAVRDASGRLMDDLARQVVDDLLNMTCQKEQ